MKLLILMSACIAGYGAILFLLHAVYSFIKGGCGQYAPFLPSSGRIKKRIITEVGVILSTAPTPLTVADLGCGTGTLLLPLAKRFPTHRFVGYEWDGLPYFIAKKRAKRLKNVTILRQNFMTHDYKDTNIVLCYGVPDLMTPLGAKLHRELPVGAFIFSEVFKLEHVPLYKTIRSSAWGVTCNLYIHKQSRR